jgi:glyoxylase-like metal-dependent hydrolase (beta-lactamase superfamily II)
LTLQQLQNNVFYLPGASNVGLAVGEGDQAVLIDSGVGLRSGRQILKLFRERDLRLAAILNTHCHGDHVGGNCHLVEHTGACVYAPRYDAAVIECPDWSTMCLFGGAEPLEELRVPRFAPQPCPVDIVANEGPIEVAGVTVESVSLPGHTRGHSGYVVDDVFFVGDCLAGEAELTNARIGYAYSITMYLASLQKLAKRSCAFYVLGHGTVVTDIVPLIERNARRVTDTLELIGRRLERGCAESSELLEALMLHHDIRIQNAKQYFHWYSVLHAYLSHLYNSGQIRHEIRDHRLLWSMAKGARAC